MSIKKFTMDQHGAKTETSMKVHGGLKEMHGYIKLV
jgi:hypothetical protein